MNHQQMDAHFSDHDLFVSPLGNDQWSGRLADPAKGGGDGPVATLEKARDRVREQKRRAQLPGPITVWLRGGNYSIKEPLLFAPEDSGPVTYAPYPGEQVVLDGGQRIQNWRIERRGDQELWVTDLPEVADGRWYFRQLFVNGARRARARLPKVGPAPENRSFFWIDSAPGLTPDTPVDHGSASFHSKPDDMREFSHLQDIEVVVLHFWIEERMPILSFDPATRLVRSTHQSMFRLTDDLGFGFAKYYLDNVFDALTEPGEWYLERSIGRLYYIPLPGESPDTAEVYAPRTTQLLRLIGDPVSENYVEYLRFENITFQHTDWVQPPGGVDPAMEHAPLYPKAQYAAAPQSATHVPGALYLTGTRYCSIENCILQHIGWYAIELADGCRSNRIVGNEISDLGAGGIKLNGTGASGPRTRHTGDNVITDNHISQGGRVFHSAVGILLRHTFGNQVMHNHIHDLYYSGISCGWVWGYAESVAHNNRLEKNHIHNLGHGWLSDMGGIYTLGVQPGTVIRGNLIHDVEAACYGGWAIYPDEGSSHLVIENNLCYRTTQQPFHQHYGRENIIRNNIFAFGRLSQIALSRIPPKEYEMTAHVAGQKAFTFEHNIVVTREQPVFQGGYLADLRKNCILGDNNIYWSISAQPILFCSGDPLKQAPMLSWTAWQATGRDSHSLIADPLFRNLAQDDFALQPDSPALALGFQPLDLRNVGPRPAGQRDVGKFDSD
jgi:hypothetical protein